MRSRLWRVDRVEGDVIAATPLDGRDAASRRFSTRLERIAPGSMPFPDTSAVGPPSAQRLLTDAYRLSLIHGTAPILGLQRSRAIPTEFQLVPLLKAIGKDRVRLLIADDVGTGKTIEAGLILAELLARGQARRVLVAVPANLRDQWAEALEHFFHLSPTIVAGHLLPALERQLMPGQSVWAAHDVVVASIDYLKTRTELVLDHGWDMVIIDEAHLAAKPHAVGSRDPDMQRWQFAARAAERVAHLILLTATPHNGYRDSYASLFDMLDPSLTVEAGGEIQIRRDQAREHVVQRRRRDIESWYEEHGRESPFPERDQDEVIITGLSSELRDMLAAIAAYADRLHEGSTSRHINSWIAAHLQKRALSSPEALRISLKNRLKVVQSRTAVESTTRSVVDAQQHVADSLVGEDASDEERSTAVDLAASTLGRDAEIELIESALEMAERVTPAKDTKLQRLFEVLGGTPRTLGGRLNKHRERRRAIVFTRFRDTLEYIAKQLERETKKKTSVIPEDLQVFTIHGQMTLRERWDIFAQFERADPAVLVATDCISEGLNLQRHCAELVHYELPWNPNRLEQRNGRIDRYGQPEPTVGIRLLVLDDALDHVLLERIVKKAREMFESYGYVPPFLANPDILHHVSREAGKGVRVRSLFDDDPTFADPFDPETMDKVVEESFFGQEGVSLGAVQDALDATREAVGGPEQLAAFVDLALGYYGMGRADVRSEVWTIDGTHPDLADVIGDPGKTFSFDPTVGLGDPDVDVVDVSHSLVRRLIDLTRERSHLPDCEGRIAALHTPDVERVTGILHILARYVALGDPPVLLEELTQIASPIFGDHDVPSAESLSRPSPGAGTRSSREVSEDAHELIDRPDLPDRVEAAVQARRDEIAAMHADLEAPWAKGLDRVEVASWDLVAVTVLYPAEPA